MVDNPAVRRALAEKHVIRGRDVVARQRALIMRIRSQGRDSDEADRLLVQFEESLAIFEQDLARLTAEGTGAEN